MGFIFEADYLLEKLVALEVNLGRVSIIKQKTDF